MKNSLKHISFLVIAFLMIGCQKDELPISEVNLGQNAKSWYDENHNSILNENLFFSGSPDWENYFQVGDDIYFPIVSDLTKVKKKNGDYTKNFRSFTKPYLIITKKNGSDFEESLKVYISSNEKLFLSFNKTLSLPFLHYNSKNFRIRYSHTEKNNVHNEFSNIINKLKTSSKSGGCEQYWIIQIDYYNDGSVEETIVGTFEVCSGSGEGGGSSGGGGIGGGGGSGGDGSTPIDGIVHNDPPDCNSFSYQNVSSNWKATVSKGIFFNVSTYTGANQTNITVYNIDFGNELFTFETWKEDRFTNELDNASAAIITAAALDNAMKFIANHYKDKWGFSQTQIEQHFKDVLKNEFTMMTGGGRVRTGNPYGLNPIQFQHNWFGYGNCN